MRGILFIYLFNKLDLYLAFPQSQDHTQGAYNKIKTTYKSN